MTLNLILNQYRNGSGYKDEIGVLYHFPYRYLKLLEQTPARFIYYEPRTGGKKVYFGTGIVRSVYEDTEEANHYYAELTDYKPFLSDVKYDNGPEEKPWEYWGGMRHSVRQIDQNIFENILGANSMNILPIAEAWQDSISNLKLSFDKEFRSNLKLNIPQLQKIKRIVELFERPSRITNAVKAQRGHNCQLCGKEGFVMRNGKNYCEVHHLFHLSDNPPPQCLEPFYLVVLCATCHRRMHYAKVGEPSRCDDGWNIIIDNSLHHFRTI